MKAPSWAAATPASSQHTGTASCEPVSAAATSWTVGPRRTHGASRREVGLGVDGGGVVGQAGGGGRWRLVRQRQRARRQVPQRDLHPREAAPYQSKGRTRK